MTVGILGHPWLRHLRLPFNLLLAPIFLFGATAATAVSGAAAPLCAPDFWIAFASVHLFLYGGATAFNSFYDRDQGPVGGMLEPPAVDPGLLRFSLLVQAAGLLLAALVGAGFTATYLVMAAISVAYSHPAVRLKAHPILAIVAIAVGQGMLGFVLGWSAVAPLVGLASAATLGRMAVTASVVTALYLVTQSYQTVEDRVRGDLTLPVLLGPGNALRIAVAILMPAGVGLAVDLVRWAGPLVAAGSIAGLLGLSGWLLSWGANFDETATIPNFWRAMRVTTVASGLFGLLMLMLLALGPAGGAP